MESVNLLLDTHTLIWWLINSPQLSTTAKQVISNQHNRVFVSSVSAWEIATKFRIGKLPQVRVLIDDLEGHIRRERFAALSMTMAHAKSAGMLPGPHRDPFDRMLIAQARIEGLQTVTNDPVFSNYGVSVVW